MARMGKSKATLQAENAILRKHLQDQARGTAAAVEHLANAFPSAKPASAELRVGIRNISDNTIGIPPYFAGDPVLHLHSDTTGASPAIVAIVSHATWMQLRKSSYVAKGLIMRDDSVLGGNYEVAPADRPEELAPGYAANAIPDPVEWISSRTEAQIREDLDKITCETSLRRLRRVVDDAIRVEQDKYPKEDLKRAKKAVQALSATYQMLDHTITTRLESSPE